MLILLNLSYCSEGITISPWTDIFKGVQHATGWTDVPRLQRVNAIRIDTQDPDIAFYTTPSNGALPRDTTWQTGSQFMASSGVQVAINSHFFVPLDEEYKDLLGVSVSNGQIVSALENRNDRARTLLITQNNQASFQHTYTSTNLSGIWTAVESFSYILVNGVPWIDYADPLAINPHPRSAVGLSYDGRYMILLTIDGRQTGYSEGATFYEESLWLIRFGAYNGLNFDGGGSSHILISDGYGGSTTLNSPSENRAVGSHLGVYAAPLPLEFPGDYEPDGDVDFLDFAWFAADWLKTSNFNPISDMHNSEDDIIDLFDLSVFAQNWLNGLN